MRKVYKAAIPAALGGAALGGMWRVFTGARDGSFGVGNASDNLRLLTAKNDYLDSLVTPVQLPKRSRSTPKLKALTEALDEGDEKDEKKKEKVASFNFDNVRNPFTTFFRGSARPTGKESLGDIPAAFPLLLGSSFAGLSIGGAVMGKRLKNKASNKLKEERDKAKREFEAALVYEQEQAYNRGKRACEESDLVAAVDEFLTAASRCESLEKTAGWEKPAIGLTGLLLLLSGYHGFQRGYGRTSGDIMRREKEKLTGANHSYEDVLKNMESMNIDSTDLGLSRHRAPTISTRYVDEELKPKKKKPSDDK